MDGGSQVNLPSGGVDKLSRDAIERGSFERALSLQSLELSLFTFQFIQEIRREFQLASVW